MTTHRRNAFSVTLGPLLSERLGQLKKRGFGMRKVKMLMAAVAAGSKARDGVPGWGDFPL